VQRQASSRRVCCLHRGICCVGNCRRHGPSISPPFLMEAVNCSIGMVQLMVSFVLYTYPALPVHELRVQ
jgi:hypothetical protein